MKVISETCHAHLIQYLHLYWFEVPDERYSRNVSCTLNSISTFVLVWGTWWKVISETCHAHLIQCLHLYWWEVPDESYFRNVSCTLNSISTFVLGEVPDESYFRNVSCTLNSISTFVLVWGTWWKLFQKRVMHT